MINITGELIINPDNEIFGLVLWLDTTDSGAAEKRAGALLGALKVISVQVGLIKPPGAPDAEIPK